MGRRVGQVERINVVAQRTNTLRSVEHRDNARSARRSKKWCDRENSTANPRNA